MKLFALVLIVVALALPVVAQGCITPTDGESYSGNITFCTGVYYFDAGITISGTNSIVDCQGAVFNGWAGKIGITIKDSNNLTLSGCRIVNYDLGLLVSNSTVVFTDDNHLVRNDFGQKWINVTKSASYNQDISLVEPFVLINSSNNVLALSNKRVKGAFCEFNFCNEDKSAIARFLQPKTTPAQMSSWLKEQVTGKSEKKLKSWVFSIFGI